LKGNLPLWVSSAIWLKEPGELLLIDPMQNKLLAYGLDGVPRPTPSVSLASTGEFQPNVISSMDGNGFLLELADGTLVDLDRALRVRQDEIVLSRDKNASGFRVGSLYQWKAYDDSIVAYGALFQGSERSYGFFRVSPERSEGPEMLTPLPDRSFYLIGNSYITMVGSAAYYVVMDKHPSIYKAVPGRKAEKLAVFPEDPELRTRPDFTTRMSGPATAAPHFKELEGFRVISGLYSQGGQLYLLARKPDGTGGTAWLLYQIDPDKKSISSKPLRLPTSAHHLTVVPSEEAWILIERGPVVGELQSQTIDRIVVVPTSFISSMTPPPSCPAR
jgi:hypothetical protein